MKRITEEEFDRDFTVMEIDGTNTLEYEQVKDQPIERVWTLIEDIDGNPWLANGFHVVNRVGYWLTEEPWTEDTEVDLS